MEDFKIDFSSDQDRDRFISYIKTLKGVHIINVDAEKYIRTEGLNDYYHGVILTYWGRATGHTVSDLHEMFKEMFIPYVTFQNHMDLSTADCSQQEMIEYCDHIRNLYTKFFSEPANEFRPRPKVCSIPPPESVIRPKK